MSDYDSRDALGLAELVATGVASPSELLEEAIARHERLHAQINAVVIPMLEEARAAAAAELPASPFRGVPFLVKDLHAHIKGVRTTNGCRMFEDFVPDHDAELTARYRRAGLVIFGKTASPEFGLTTTTESAVFGATRNPWNLEYTAGGSSGGAAAAVAGGIIPAANASDGGGSIRIPASCCGLFGMKPTRARNPSGPDVGEGWSGMSTAHAVTRSVRDSAALLDATQGPDLGAPYWAPPPERPYLQEVGAAPGKLRVALQTVAFNGVDVDPECVEAVQTTADLLDQLGHEVEESFLHIDAEELGAATRVIIFGNLASVLDDRAKVLGRPLAEGDIEPLTWRMVEATRHTTAADYARAVRTIHATGRAVEQFLGDYDVLLTPTMANTPARIGVLSLSNDDIGEAMGTLMKTTGFTQLFNASGHPAMSVPLHWSRNGLPVGVQFAGRFGDEATLYRLAAQLEQARPWAERRPAL